MILIIAHASLFKQFFCWANSGTTTAKNIYLSNQTGRPDIVFGTYHPNQASNIDPSTAISGARCVMTKIAAARFYQRCHWTKWKMNVTKVLHIFVGIKTRRLNVRRQLYLTHAHKLSF
jgi:hypothetical protein